MAFTRDHPSPRYTSLTDMYRRMHQEGAKSLGLAAHDTFQGMSLLPQVQHIKQLIEQTGARSILDYGSGKGLQYRPQPLRIDGEPQIWDTVADYWNVDYVACYDPSYPPFSAVPTGEFDGVICTDVLEHCPEEDLPWILDELFGFATRFVFAGIAGFPALKQLPDGQNAHCTVRSLAWWQALFEAHAAHAPGVVWHLRYFRREGAENASPVVIDEVRSEAIAPGSTD